MTRWPGNGVSWPAVTPGPRENNSDFPALEEGAGSLYYASLKEMGIREESEGAGPPWKPAPARPALAGREVHVWRIELDRAPARVEDLSHVLSPDEEHRAARFYFQKDRDHYTVARASLRLILALYLEKDPKELTFSYSPYGKPSLASRDPDKDLRFNLSHSGHLALAGVTFGLDIGIDVERVREDFASEEIAQRFFSAREVACLRSLPEGGRAQAFFHCWTRKEAYIKARGEGLSMPLDKFDVAFAPGEAPALLGTRIDPREVERWSILDIAIDPGYAAALAVEGHGLHMEYWEQGPVAGGQEPRRETDS
ncbi:MAG TPA: 4'-phosphopantetheinyl transferase superfamily protein [Blastocatellia bacterium]|nr:4'-phosphopantetheinyl transferase superfamily protein [Blastocatellia bacterium]